MKLMQCLLAALTVCCLFTSAEAQYTKAFNYQAEFRDARGLPRRNVSIPLRIDIVQNNRSIYAEQFLNGATDSFGLIAIRIGQGLELPTGTPSTVGNFSKIRWTYLPTTLRVSHAITNEALSEIPILAVPISIQAETAHKADTALVALKLAGVGDDANGKFVGAVQVFGMNEGAASVQGPDWQQVTKTCYDKVEDLFGTNDQMGLSYNKPAIGYRREYYVVIRKGDNINSCAGAETQGRKAMGSEWRFYLSWKEKAGHKFQLGRNWGGLDDGSVDWVKIPPMSSYPSPSHPMYWRLEARMNPNCTNTQMKVHSIHIVAYDKLITNPTDTVAINLDTDNRKAKETFYEFGVKGGIVINPSREVSIYNALSIKKEKEFKIDVGTKLADISNPSGVVYYEVVGSEYHVFGGNILTDDSQNHGLGVPSRPVAHAYIKGLTRTGVLEVVGGDVAEARHTTTGKALPKGAVVIFDEKGTGKIQLTNKPYDKKVAGVISGAGKYYAGVTLLQEELAKGAQPVAQVGTVEVLTVGPVEVGDLLTTSTVEGYAMAVKNPLKSIGCTIGKATSSLKKGERGLVEMQVEKH